MGYYTTVDYGNTIIPAENLDEAYKTMCDLNRMEHLKQGEAWGGSEFNRPAGSTSLASSPKKYFSYMPWNYDETCENAEQILNHLGFVTRLEENGDLRILFFDSKEGQEDLFLKAIEKYLVRS